MPAVSEAKTGDVTYGNKSENSVWSLVIVGVVILGAAVALAAIFTKEKK